MELFNLKGKEMVENALKKVELKQLEPKLIIDSVTIDMDQLMSYIEDFIVRQDIAESSRKTYRHALERFLKFLQIKNLYVISEEVIIAYKDYLTATLKPATVSLSLTVLRKFLSFLDRRYQTGGLFIGMIEMVRNPRVKKFGNKDSLSADQISIILNALSKKEKTLINLRNQAIFTLMVTSALRVSEVAELKIENLTNRFGRAGLFVSTKGNKERDYIKLTPLSEKALREYLSYRQELELKVIDEKAPLFASTSNCNLNGRMTAHMISKIVKEILVENGFDSKRITAHSLRHTAISLSLESGTPPIEVMRMARHQDFSSTAAYIHIKEEEYRQAEFRIDQMIQEKLRSLQ